MRQSDFEWLAKVMAWGCLALLAYMLYAMTFKSALHAWTLQHFVPQQCEMISKKVVEKWAGNSGTTDYATVQYRGTGENSGQIYKGLSPFATSGSWASQKAVIDKLPEPGEPVPCFIDPQNPARAYLSLEINPLGMLLTMIPLFFVLVGLWFWRGYRRVKREEEGG